MSKTKREYRVRTDVKTGPTKMKPYLADKNKGEPKFAISLGEGTRITETNKLVAKNANRSRKKAARQEAKRNIQNTSEL